MGKSQGITQEARATQSTVTDPDYVGAAYRAPVIEMEMGTAAVLTP